MTRHPSNIFGLRANVYECFREQAQSVDLVSSIPTGSQALGNAKALTQLYKS